MSWPQHAAPYDSWPAFEDGELCRLVIPGDRYDGRLVRLARAPRRSSYGGSTCAAFFDNGIVMHTHHCYLRKYQPRQLSLTEDTP
jgi:hypothetical protein